MEEAKQGRCSDETAPTEPPNCPERLSKRIYKDGIRKNNGQRIQRYICRDCGYRFSDPSFSRRPDPVEPYEQCNQSNPDPWASHRGAREVEEYNKSTESEIYRLVCANEAKNLAATETTGTVVAGEISETKSLLLKFALYMKKQGQAETTILTRGRQMSILVKRGADIHDPESIKEIIANQTWVNKRKQNAVETPTAAS